MNRSEWDANQAMKEGTWQNRQGRDNEWNPAPAGTVGFVMGVVGIAMVSLVSLLVVVLA
jgi:hypothetical protein